MSAKIHIEPIAIFTTGGTIDKAYFDDLSEYQVSESVVQKLLDIARVTVPYSIAELLRKDSLEMDDADRAVIREAILATSSTRIIVTHGTDTMIETARHVGVVPGKTIVFVGALAPARFAETDAPLNLGMALAVAQVAPNGTYITMNGTVFPADRVRKERPLGRFVLTSDNR